MSKIALKSTALLAAALILTPVVAPVASAATYDSKANVAFEADTSTNDPVDPTDPDTPKTDPEPDPEPGTPGPLSIDFASTLEFGTQTISTTDKTYYAHAQQYTDGTQRPNFAQVTDKRGTLAGWSLSVKTGSQFHLATVDPTTTPETSAAAGDYITGAAIHFSAGQVAGAQGTAPSTVAATLDLSNNDQTIVTAAANEGVGTWIYRLGASEADYDTSATATDAVASKGPITLTVPGTAVTKAAAYSTDLIWTLSDTPSNP